MRQIYKQPHQGESASKTRERDQKARDDAFEQLKRQVNMGVAGRIALTELTKDTEQTKEDIDGAIEFESNDTPDPEDILRDLWLNYMEPEPTVPEPDEIER
jgi:hypothetical protein